MSEIQNNDIPSEETLNELRVWLNNPFTKILHKKLTQQIEDHQKAWVFADRVPAAQPILDYNAGFCRALFDVTEFLETGGIKQDEPDERKDGEFLSVT